jgi:hypothetical protein
MSDLSWFGSFLVVVGVIMLGLHKRPPGGPPSRPTLH